MQQTPHFRRAQLRQRAFGLTEPRNFTTSSALYGRVMPPNAVESTLSVILQFVVYGFYVQMLHSYVVVYANRR